MDVYAERVAGLDIGKADLKACVRTPSGPHSRSQQVRTFQTTTAGILDLAEWLTAEQVTVVGMESTGVYWKPVFYLLEGQFTCWLFNPQQVKNAPGRKTDVTDAQWLAKITETGLVRPSFIPPEPIRQLRDLTRYRASIVRDRTRDKQRLLAVLEDAGIKLSTVATDVFGVSGRAILAALIDGNSDALELADLARGRLRSKLPVLIEALAGRFTPHHARLVTLMLTQIDTDTARIAELDSHIAQAMPPFDAAHRRLITIPGISHTAAAAIIAEIGTDMTRFATPADLVSWAGVCPGNNESAGIRRTAPRRRGNRHLRAILYESAAAAARTKNTYLADKYHRLAHRRGSKRALVALSRIILQTCWHLITTNTDYHDLGPDYLTNLRNPHQRLKDLTHQLNKLGYTVTLTPTAA